jgi:hypothetical protein
MRSGLIGIGFTFVVTISSVGVVAAAQQMTGAEMITNAVSAGAWLTPIILIAVHP